MRRSETSSTKHSSHLVLLFADRVPTAHGNPECAIQFLASRLRKLTRPAGPPELYNLLHRRNVLSIDYSRNINCDGLLQPLGSAYDAGFKMIVNRKPVGYRWRFTIAHELCHTFFYELVPELKFYPHGVNQEEERLCNLGAAELLLPANPVKSLVKKFSVSLESLEYLASWFQVSAEVMLLRLRDLKLWIGQLTVWRPKFGGGFGLDRMVGGTKSQWEWSDERIPKYAWESGRTTRGRTYVQYRDCSGGLKLKPVSYQIVRRRDTLIGFWTNPSHDLSELPLPLFRSQARPASDQVTHHVS